MAAEGREWCGRVKATVAGLSGDTRPIRVILCVTIPRDCRFHPRGGRSDQHHETPQPWLVVTQTQHLFAMPAS